MPPESVVTMPKSKPRKKPRPRKRPFTFKIKFPAKPRVVIREKIVKETVNVPQPIAVGMPVDVAQYCEEFKQGSTCRAGGCDWNIVSGAGRCGPNVLEARRMETKIQEIRKRDEVKKQLKLLKIQENKARREALYLQDPDKYCAAFKSEGACPRKCEWQQESLADDPFCGVPGGDEDGGVTGIKPGDRLRQRAENLKKRAPPRPLPIKKVPGRIPVGRKIGVGSAAAPVPSAPPLDSFEYPPGLTLGEPTTGQRLYPSL